MDIQTQEHKRVVVVSVSGRIDSATAGEFEDVLNEFTQHGKNNLVLDLSEVDFISSAGLRVLVTARKAVKSAGGEIVFADSSEQVIETLEIAGLDVLFEQYPDRETAVGSF
ncbi:MAG: STAS domain-containing protein [Anaerolineales bacterium]|jgi:anti-sigma B factor antagonist